MSLPVGPFPRNIQTIKLAIILIYNKIVSIKIAGVAYKRTTNQLPL
jgi:hypothetical protein